MAIRGDRITGRNAFLRPTDMSRTGTRALDMAQQEAPAQLFLERRHLLHLAITVPLLLALAGCAMYGTGTPLLPGALPDPIPPRRILTADGTILAEGQPEYRRYPEGTLAAHLIGFSGRIQPDGRYGLEGVEYSYDQVLQMGEDVRLTIDPTYQAAAQSELRRTIEETEAESGAVVMLEAGTGRILAAASYPEFDPNNQGFYDRDALINRAFLEQHEPGSVMKPMIIAAALEDGRITPQQLIESKPCKRVGWNTFCDVVSHDDHLLAKDILRFSSNTGMLVIAEEYEPGEIYRWLHRFGFGRSPELQSLFTRPGIINPWQHWVPQDQASIVIGQSIAVTPLQMAMAFSVFANDGQLVTPYLVEGESVPEPYQVISPWGARELREMLQHTVDNSGARRARIPDVTVAGKTGPADVYDAAAGTYLEDDYNLSFSGFYPADEPQVIMSVYVHKPRVDTSSTYVAAPPFRDFGTNAVAAAAQRPAPSEVAPRETGVRQT